MHRRGFMAAVMAALLLTGCSRNGSDSSGVKDGTDGEYRVFSNGVCISEENLDVPEKNSYDYADFYIPEGMVTDYYSRYELSDEEREVYDSVKESLGRLKSKAPLLVDSAVYQKILETIRLEQLAYPHVSGRSLDYNGSAQEFEVLFTYRLSADEISSMNMAAEKAAKEIIAQLTPEMDDYEKLKFFHDYLILNCETDASYDYADTVYGALVRKKALCEGYTKAFSYLCNLVGIENVIVTGETYVPHTWNMVKLGGNWYHVDVTWDKSDDELHKLYPDVILYQYFMVTDSVIENNHKIWNYPAEAPKAYGIEENYFVREGADVSSREELLTASENAIISAVKSRSSGAMVKFDTTDLYLASEADLENEELFTPVIEKVRSECGENIKLSWTGYYAQYRILTFIIEYES